MTALLSTELLPMIIRLLAQQPAPEAFSNLQEHLCLVKPSLWLKLDSEINESITLFTASSDEVKLLKTPQFNRSTESLGSIDSYSYSLRSDNHCFELDVWIQYDLFSVDGWNHYSIQEDGFYINGILVPEFKIDGQEIRPSEHVMFEVESNEKGLRVTQKQMLVFGVDEGDRKSVVEVLGRPCEYHFDPVSLHLSTAQFKSTESIQPLKQFLSSEATLSHLYRLLDQATTDDQINLII